ncbi:MAG: hypothetical protein KIG88_06675 [Weeksellaceae bacterium]|nr:hypothetical protein [Weeksellaceae bacterium]
MTIKRLLITLIILLNFSTICLSQVVIGKKTIGASVLLDFAENTTNGLVLPHINDIHLITDATVGTVVFDKITKKAHYYDGVQWIAINKEEGALPLIAAEKEQGGDQGVIIGSEESTAKGVLILESSDKAMVLPKIYDPAKNVPSPYPGMICYDTRGKHVYIFNGLRWEIVG